MSELCERCGGLGRRVRHGCFGPMFDPFSKRCPDCGGTGRKAPKGKADPPIFGEAEPVEGAGDKAIHLGRLEGVLSIVEGTGEFSREGLAEVLRKSVAGLRGEVEPNEPESDHAKCETCGGREVINTGECREAMSGPTCRNPACPPCQTPETEPCPDCQPDPDAAEM